MLLAHLSLRFSFSIGKIGKNSFYPSFLQSFSLAADDYSQELLLQSLMHPFRLKKIVPLGLAKVLFFFPQDATSQTKETSVDI